MGIPMYLATSGGTWLQRVDSNSVLDAESFAADVAAQFGLDPKTVTVVERNVEDDDARQAIVAALAAGTFEGLAVAPAPTPPKTVTPRETAIAKIDDAVKDATVPASVKAALTAIKAALA